MVHPGKGWEKRISPLDQLYNTDIAENVNNAKASQAASDCRVSEELV